MFCGQCGSKLMDDVVFCTSCGAKIVDSDALEQSQSESIKPTQPQVQEAVAQANKFRPTW